jgi:CubicO group peptidase (beta-lactamase class C family)
MTLLQGFLLALFAGGTAWSFDRLRRVARIGAAYKARVVCSIVFGTGRTLNPLAPCALDEVSADSYRLLRLFRCRVDRDARAVSAALWGFPARTAVFRGNAGPASPAREWPVAAAAPDLERLVASAFTEPDRKRLRRTRAILVVRDGEIVAERYAQGFSASTRFPGWSMTKSVQGALVGLLIGDRRLSLDDRQLMPGWQDPDPRGAITLEDLLRMRSGLAFSEVYEDLSSDVVEMLFSSPDTAGYAASRPLQYPPGTNWSYASGTTNILSGIARRIVGEEDYPTWPRRALFAPLGMDSAMMEPDDSGTFVASSFMLATARDWARFGQLYLQEGVWEGRRLLPEGWVRFSTTPTPQSPGGLYGAHWWLGLKPELGGGTPAAARIPRDAFFAVGHEGQVLTVIPSRRLVIVRLGLSIYLDAWNHAAFLAQWLDALGAT